MTKQTARPSPWTERTLLGPALRGLAKPFRLLWAALLFPLRPVWRWLLRPVWLRVLRPVLWLPLRWTGQRLWRWLLRPAWSLLRWTGKGLAATPRLVARSFPNQGWAAGSAVLLLTAVLLLAPGAVNAKIRNRLTPVMSNSSAHSLGPLHPQISVNLNPFAGWGLAPASSQNLELLLQHDQAQLRVLRVDQVQSAEDFLRQYASSQLGVRDPGRFYPRHVKVKDAQGNPVKAVEIDQDFRAPDPHDTSLSCYHQVVLYHYSTTVLLLVLTIGEGELAPHAQQLRDLKASVRITP